MSFSSKEVGRAYIAAQESNSLPEVSILGGNRTIPDSDGSPSESVSFTATATDSDGSIASTGWIVNGTIVSTGLSASILLGDGNVEITFRATDDDGAASTTSVTITVEPPNQPPVVAIAGGDRTILDSDGASGEVVSFSATATDNDGSITSSEWLVNSAVVATGLTPSLPLPDGASAVTFKATDDEGAQGSHTVMITVEEPSPTYDYDRDDYMPGGWADIDGDCINTRHEVLIIESLVPVSMSPDGCFVDEGLWDDPYTGLTFTNPSDVDIDHFVPLSEAHDSGAYAWTNEAKQAFANDMINKNVLIAVDDGTNSSKGARDPAEWLPPNTTYHCEYVRNWVEVKSIYGLEFDEAEIAAIESILGDDLHHATRPTQNGLYLNGEESTARFSMGLTRNDGCPFYTQAGTEDLVDISISLTPEAEHIGKELGIYLLPVLDGNLYYLTSAGELIPFDGDLNQLQTFANPVIEETYEFTLVRGYFGAPIIVDFFIAYWPNGGELIFTPTPTRLTIN
ncbi:MAG: DUF1524 domain-containing protein [Gammaproteobacteria bacterium]